MAKKFATPVAWKQAGIPLGQAERSILWRIGDWWNEGKKFGHGERKRIVSSPRWGGPDYDTCRVAGRVARRFQERERYLSLGFAHHQAAAPLANQLALPMLRQAVREHWNVNRMRSAVNHARWFRPITGGDIVDDLQDLIRAGRKYRGIVADVPWRIWSTPGKPGGSEFHYQTMATSEICRLPVADVSDDCAFLFLSTPAVTLEGALLVLRSWGFEYKTHMCWRKSSSFGKGYYFRMIHELFLVGRKPKAPTHFKDDSILSVLDAPRTRHSEKPAIVHKLVQRACDGPYLEIFGRSRIDGWTVCGNQLERAAPTHDLAAAD